jgi:hypothetical protein
VNALTVHSRTELIENRPHARKSPEEFEHGAPSHHHAYGTESEHWLSNRHSKGQIQPIKTQ